MQLFTDGVTTAVERALSGVAERQRVTANNIANLTTPGFRASRVNFESDLAAAIDRDDPSDAAPSIVDAGTPARGDGNTVALDEETEILVKSGVQYEALVN